MIDIPNADSDSKSVALAYLMKNRVSAHLQSIEVHDVAEWYISVIRLASDCMRRGMLRATNISHAALSSSPKIVATYTRVEPQTQP